MSRLTDRAVRSPELSWDDVVARAQNLTRHFRLIRSKDAGPFMLTTDLFCHDAAAYQRAVEAGVLEPSFWAAAYGTSAEAVEVYAAVHAIKASFPRPIASGELADTDITGGQQYALVVEALARGPLGEP